MTLVLAIGMALLVLGILVLPLIDRTRVQPVPEPYDPEYQDLEEERDSLMHAVRELDRRRDFSVERRSHLRDRYLRKAAIVEQRLAQRAEGPAPLVQRRGQLPVSWILLLVLIVPSVALIGGHALPRVSTDGTVTTNRQTDIAAGREVQRLQRAVRSDPSVDTLAALGDAYWEVVNARPVASGSGPDAQPPFFDETRETYDRLVEVASAAGRADMMAIAQRRLGYLDLLSGNVADAETRLERAVELDPDDGEALFTLGQVRYSLGRLAGAAEAWSAYLATPLGEGDDETAELAARAQTLAPLVDAVQRDGNEASYLALADALWEAGDRPRAASFYAERLQRFEGEPPRAVRRLGMALFFAGNAEQAVLALERARVLEPTEPETLLFLGNAYRSLNDRTRAVEAWRAYIGAVGGAANAGRVPQLIAEASRGPASSAEAAAGAAAGAAATGGGLFAANCVSCHGAGGSGAVGPRLAGNPRASDGVLVENTVRFGRNLMPGFGVLLSGAEIELIVDYVASLARP